MSRSTIDEIKIVIFLASYYISCIMKNELLLILICILMIVAFEVQAEEKSESIIKNNTTDSTNDTNIDQMNTVSELITKGDELMNQGKYQDAVDVYNQAIQINATNGELWFRYNSAKRELTNYSTKMADKLKREKDAQKLGIPINYLGYCNYMPYDTRYHFCAYR